MQNIIFSQIELNELLSQFGILIDEKLKNFNPVTPETLPELPERPTRHQLADHFNVSLTTIWKWSKSGILQSYKIGGQVRYNRDEVLKALIQVKNLKYKR
jgi:excisionase family DNA binding protein